MASATRRFCFTLGAALVLASTAALAQSTAPEQAATAPIVLAQSGTTAPRPATMPATTDEYPPLQAGVRKAATEGPEALRRYVHRTRMIYAWYYPDFAIAY